MFLGLDLGTSNVKVLVVEQDGSIVAQGSASMARHTTPDGGVEQDVDQIWDVTCRAIGQAAFPLAGAGRMERSRISPALLRQRRHQVLSRQACQRAR